MFGKPTIGSNQPCRDSVALGFEPAIANPFDASRNHNRGSCPTRKATLTGRLRRYRKNQWLRGLDLTVRNLASLRERNPRAPLAPPIIQRTQSYKIVL
jgi:hypothetical protein